MGKVRSILIGLAACVLQLAGGLFWFNARHPRFIAVPPVISPSVSLVKPVPLHSNSASEDHQAAVSNNDNADDLSLHLRWVIARPAAIGLVYPAPLYALSDLSAMLPPEIGPWLRRYEQALKSGGSGEVTPDQRSELEALLKTVSPPASALAVTRLGETLALWGSPDASQQAALGRLGLIAAEREPADLTPGDPAAAPAIAAVNQLPEDKWWEARDGVYLERLFTLKKRWNPEGSEANGWALVGLPPAFYLQGRSTEGLTANNVLLTTGWTTLTDSQRTDVRWHQGVILTDLKQYKEAIPFVESTAHTRNFHYARDASSLLFSLLLQINDLKAAEAQVQAYAREWSPPQYEVDDLMRQVADRKWQKEHIKAR